MTDKELAAKYHITEEKLNREWMAFVQNEGYDDVGNEYETFGDWLNRKAIKETRDPVDGGRGAGMLGRED